MRRAEWATLAGIAGILCVLAADVAAQGPQRMGPGRHAPGEGPRQRQMVPPQERPGSAAPGEAGPDSAELRGKGHRLSPEERRQLRRDVHEAGRDLYPGKMMPRRRETGRE